MKTRFLGQAYQSRSPILASQTAINIFPESSEQNTEEVGAFYGTPGLKSVFTGKGSVRGLHVTAGALYAVIGNTVWRLDTNYRGTVLGTIPGWLPVSMADNGSQIAIAHESGWAWVSTTGTSLGSVAGAPGGSILTAQDNYVLFTNSNDGQFGLTALGDLSSIDPLDIATAEGLPDDLVSILSDHREAWLLGTKSIEVWADTGAQFFPFEREPGGFIEQGCAASMSPAKLDNSVFWLGADDRGQGVVYRANAYIPLRISTHALEFAIARYSRIDDAIGFAYQEEGHDYYVLIFPTGDATWVYDCATQAWHQRAWLDPDTGLLHRHRMNCYAFFNGDHLVGDWENGKIYRMSLDYFDDDGDPIYRERAWEIADNEQKRTRVDLLELVAITGDGDTALTESSGTSTTGFWDQGFWNPGFWRAGFWDGFGPAVTTVPVPIAPTVWLEVSRDSGRRFGYKRPITIGALGQRYARCRWRRAGYGRNLVFRVATTMRNRVQWVGANMRGEGLSG